MKELQKLLSKDEFNRVIYNLYRTPRRTPLNNLGFFKNSATSLLHCFKWSGTIEKFKYWRDVHNIVMNSKIN